MGVFLCDGGVMWKLDELILASGVPLFFEDFLEEESSVPPEEDPPDPLTLSGRVPSTRM